MEKSTEIIDWIIYQEWSNDNTDEIREFIGGEFADCKLCGDSGEYETEYGPKGCNECNSRLLPFIDRNGQRVTLDWGDKVIKFADGGIEKRSAGLENDS